MRRGVALLGVIGLLVLAGCLGGSGVVDEAAIGQDAEYDWSSSAQASVNITDGNYQAVLTLENRTNVRLFGPGEFGGEAALPIEAVKYRSPNGSVYNATALSIEAVNERTVIEAPDSGGQIAYSARVRSGDLFLPVAVNGSHSVTLPPGAEVGFPIVGGATPRGFEVDRNGDRITLTWENPDSRLITVDYYQERNLYLFAFLLAGGGIVAVGGLLYFRSQLRVLASRRGDLSRKTDVDESEER